MKFEGTDYFHIVRSAKTPRDAKTLGSARGGGVPTLRSDWERIKETVMKRALRAKFTQHADLQRTLLSTGTRPLAEHTAHDMYWGDGGAKGKGLNRLGHLLMELRDELSGHATRKRKTCIDDYVVTIGQSKRTEVLRAEVDCFRDGDFVKQFFADT